jgi:hypothetical protein
VLQQRLRCCHDGDAETTTWVGWRIRDARWLALKHSRDARLDKRRAVMLELVRKNPLMLLRLLELSRELRLVLPGAGFRPRKFASVSQASSTMDTLKQTRRERAGR